MSIKLKRMFNFALCVICVFSLNVSVFALTDIELEPIVDENTNPDYAEVTTDSALLVTVSDESSFVNFVKSNLQMQKSVNLISGKEVAVSAEVSVNNQDTKTNEKVYKINLSKNEKVYSEELITQISAIDGVKAVGYDAVVSFEPSNSDVTTLSEMSTLSDDNSGVSSIINVNDKYYPQQFALSKTKVNMAWAVSMGEQSVKVGVIDSGISNKHADLKGQIDEDLSRNFFNSTSPFVDAAIHGSSVAGIIAAKTNNEVGVAGIAGNVKLVSLKCANVFGKSNLSNIISAIEYAENKGIGILNCSFGIYEDEINDAGYQALKTAIMNYSGIIIAAAGNRGNTQKSYPAAYNLDNIISVASTTSEDVLADDSTYGSTVNLAAPGDNVYSTLTLTVSEVEGTSFAAPQVTGVVALMKSLNPSLTPIQIKKMITESVDKLDSLTGKVASGGRLNALKPVLKAANLIAGDVDMSGKITATDGRLALRCAGRLETLTAKQKVLADIDEDGIVSTSDARTIVRMAARLE